jgi:hypothetical protein
VPAPAGAGGAAGDRSTQQRFSFVALLLSQSQDPALPQPPQPPQPQLQPQGFFTRLLLSLSQPEGSDTGFNVPSPPGRPSPSDITRLYEQSYAEAARQRRREQEQREQQHQLQLQAHYAQLRQRAHEQYLEGIRNGNIAPPPPPLPWFSTPVGECGRHALLCFLGPMHLLTHWVFVCRCVAP